MLGDIIKMGRTNIQKNSKTLEPHSFQGEDHKILLKLLGFLAAKNLGSNSRLFTGVKQEVKKNLL